MTGSHVAWKAVRGAPFEPSPVLAGGYLLMVNDMSAVAACFRASSGEMLRQGRLGNARREGLSASPVVVGDKVFFTNDDGRTYAVRAGPDFELLRVNDLGERVLASPALVDGRWYFRTASRLLAIGSR